MSVLEKLRKFEIANVDEIIISGGTVYCRAEGLAGRYSYSGGGSLLEVSMQFAEDYGDDVGHFTCWETNAV